MPPKVNVSKRIYKFSYSFLGILEYTIVYSGILKYTIVYSSFSANKYGGLRYASGKLYQKIQELKEEPKEVVSKCSYVLCAGGPPLGGEVL